MNSNSYETAAWRTFGMLDSDESASFDAATFRDPDLRASQREIELLAAAITITCVKPVPPRAGQLQKLQKRLQIGVRPPINWLGISGWAVAASLAVLFVLEHPQARNEKSAARPPVPGSLGAESHSPDQAPIPPHSAEPRPTPAPDTLLTETPTIPDGLGHPTKTQTKRLIQQIGELRKKLTGLEERDRERFSPVFGKSWPVVMRMAPPKSKLASEDDLKIQRLTPPMTAVLGDALVASLGKSGPVTTQFFMPPVEPSAIPIYDAARDTGTLVVSNLPTLNPQQTFNLWVKTHESGDSIHVGSLPAAAPGSSDTYDFNLGSPGIVPIEFMLTKDLAGQAPQPSDENIILLGPK